MFRLLLFTVLSLPVVGWAQSNTANLEVINPPLRINAAFSGLMLRNETEFLTPEGILDTLPPEVVLQPVLPFYATLEPAAGPDSPLTESPIPETPSLSPTTTP